MGWGMLFLVSFQIEIFFPEELHEVRSGYLGPGERKRWREESRRRGGREGERRGRGRRKKTKERE